MKYVSLDAVLAEIEKLVDLRKFKTDYDSGYRNGGNAALNNLKERINSLEVKEVDLEKEIQDHIKECLDIKFPTTDIELIKKDVAYTAKKFFELGLKAQK